MDFIFLAIDPGTAKCGLAVMDSAGAVIEIIETKTDRLEADISDILKRYGRIDRVAIGDGTGHKETAAAVRRAAGGGLEIIPVREKNTTLEARRLYLEANPRPWPARLIPFGLFGLPEEMDAWAAVAIGRNYIDSLRGDT